MSNTYFQFKQFLVSQELCAMKVCTDSCLFGALVASLNKDLARKVLDIGTGSGLLSLMLAQHLPAASIDAVELDADAFEQSKINFKNSPFWHLLTAHHISIQDFAREKSRKFDLIICNPPFFTNHLKSASPTINVAKHNDALSATDLAIAVAQLLHDKGFFWLLLPVSEGNSYIEKMFEKGLYIQSKYEILDTENLTAFRWVLGFGKEKNEPIANHKICIKNKDKSYSTAFVHLLKPYYLNL